MPNETIIPAGYQLSVTSWENDGDNYKTKVVNGYMLPQMKFIVDLISICKDHGNLYEPSASEKRKLKAAAIAVVAKHRGVATAALGKNDESVVAEDDDVFMDAVLSFLSDFGLSEGEYYVRQLDSFKVEYLPEPLHIQDVTDQFIS